MKPDNLTFKYDPETPTAHKDEFYGTLFNQIVDYAKEGKMSGSNFWAYGGEGRSTDYPTKYGMVWLGKHFLSVRLKKVIEYRSRISLRMLDKRLMLLIFNDSGDPPHEPRGWYSVYDKDTTVQVISDYNANLEKLQ